MVFSSLLFIRRLQGPDRFYNFEKFFKKLFDLALRQQGLQSVHHLLRPVCRHGMFCLVPFENAVEVPMLFLHAASPLPQNAVKSAAIKILLISQGAVSALLLIRRIWDWVWFYFFEKFFNLFYGDIAVGGSRRQLSQDCAGTGQGNGQRRILEAASISGGAGLNYDLASQGGTTRKRI